MRKLSKTVNISFVVAVSIFIIFSTTIGWAATSLEEELFEQVEEEAEFFRAEELVVTTAARYAQDIEDAPSNVTVWRREDIRRSGAQTIADLLEREVGIHVPITEESIRSAWIRGVARSRNTRILLLLDGVPIQDGVYSQAFIGEEIPIHQVEQIEFIRGPGSAMYGANAFSGVVNLQTVKGADYDKSELEFNVGSRDYRKANFLSGGSQDLNWGDESVEADYTVYGRYYETHGDGGQLRPNEDVNNPRNWRREKNYAGGMRLELGDFELKADVINYGADRIDGAHESNEGHDMRVDDLWNYRYFNQHYALAWDRDFIDYSLPMFGGESLNLSAQAQYNHYDNPGLYTHNDEWWVKPEKITSRGGGNFQLTNQWEDGSTLVAGADLEWVDIEEAQDWLAGSDTDELPDWMDEDEPDDPTGKGEPIDFRIEPQSFYNHGYYLQHTHELPDLLNSSLTLGGRYDDHEIMGDHFSPRAGFVSRPTEKDLIKIMYGEAFRAPTARELLTEDNPDWTSGNPDLDPEIIETLELQYERDLSESIRFNFAAYSNEIEDYIRSDTGAEDFDGEFYNNIGTQESVGLESELDFTYDHWQFSLGYSWVDAEEDIYEEGEFVETVESWGIPEHQFNTTLTYRPVEQLWFELNGRLISDQSREDYATASGWDLDDADGYHVFDFTLGTADLIENVNTRLRINNLFDEDYDWVDTNRSNDGYTYPAPGREITFTAGYEF